MPCHWTGSRYLTANVATTCHVLDCARPYRHSRKSTRHKMAPSICGKCQTRGGVQRGRNIYPVCGRENCVRRVWKCANYLADLHAVLTRGWVRRAEFGGLRRLSREGCQFASSNGSIENHIHLSIRSATSRSMFRFRFMLRLRLRLRLSLIHIHVTTDADET